MKIRRDGKWASVILRISKKLDGLDGDLVREEEEEFTDEESADEDEAKEDSG